YEPSLTEVLKFCAIASERLDDLERSAERITSIDGDIDGARREVRSVAAELSKRRRKAAKELTKLVSAELPALALPNAVFDVECERTDPTESGADRVAFRFSSSRSKEPDLIGKIASGGELSRAMI